MFKIKTLNAISNKIYDSFTPDRYDVSADHAAYDAVVVRSAAMHDMEFPAELAAIARAGAGYNNIPVDRCSDEGIVVFNTPGANANSVAELAVGAMIVAARNVVESVQWAATLKGSGDKVGAMAEKGKSQFIGSEVRGKKLAVLGLGAVGGKFANLAYNLKMSVVGFDPYLSVDAAWALSRAVKKSTSIEEAVADADFVTVHVPYMPTTKGYISAQLIDSMKDGVIIINMARGELVDNEAIIKALESGKVRKYITDFACDELLGLKNVIVMPHIGASTPESEDNCAVMAADQIDKYLTNGSIINSVNFPACELGAWDGARICVLHRNVPSMIANISAAISQSGVNIEHMVNKSRKELAYTVLDLQAACDQSVIDAVKAIDGVIRVRVIGG